jgi:uncharacterized protein (TIGR00369 family)
MPAIQFDPAFTGFAERARASFLAQPTMQVLGVSLDRVEPGEVELSMPFSPTLTQQHGFLHGGITASVLDTACGIATLTLMPEDAGILTIEFKVNLLAPGTGSRFRFVGRVRKPGRTVWLAEGDAYSVDENGRERLMATMTATEMTVTGRGDVKG